MKRSPPWISLLNNLPSAQTFSRAYIKNRNEKKDDFGCDCKVTTSINFHTFRDSFGTCRICVDCAFKIEFLTYERSVYILQNGLMGDNCKIRLLSVTKTELQLNCKSPKNAMQIIIAIVE